MSILAELDRAGRELAILKTKAGLFDTWTLSHATFAHEHVWCYVKAAAVVESCVRGVLRAVLQAINDASPRRHELRLSLFGLLMVPDFESLKDLRKMTEVWSKRCKIVAACTDTDETTFPLEILPLDGKTIEARHLETIWSVFGFSGTCFPSALHKMSLIEMSHIRNSLAHGEESEDEVGRKKKGDDVLRMLRFTEDTLEHLALAAELYVNEQLFRR